MSDSSNHPNKNSALSSELLFRDEVYQIIGAAMEVHTHLGCGFLESVYQEALEYELRIRKLPFQAQSPISINYKDLVLQKTFIADLLVFGKIIVEIKALDCIDSSAISQLINYLKGTGLQLGLLINFGAKSLEWKRIALTKK